MIAYASRSLTKEQRNYAQIGKEALKIVCGGSHFMWSAAQWTTRASGTPIGAVTTPSTLTESGTRI